MAVGESISKGIIRLICLLFIYTAVTTLFFDAPSWEGWYEPPLEEGSREMAIARTGVLYEFGFQLPLWLLVGLVNEYGDVQTKQIAYLIASFTLLLNGPYGCHYYYANSCATHSLCLANETSYRVGLAILACLPLVSLGLLRKASGEYQSL